MSNNEYRFLFKGHRNRIKIKTCVQIDTFILVIIGNHNRLMIRREPSKKCYKSSKIDLIVRGKNNVITIK